ncbi:hypothetical protein [Micrococcus sp. FDAARGOS_333]|uniref:hypothetical protein n=1 Tax=Micrococcus sp. FDAARGOS_333 TaxID=1930558 RepID=UPI000B4E5F52|nr:hypothetical protein [Micrococcus sp. FDAARGOS_333]PNL16903.1 hypothetical protein CEQ11_000820 [Micrococcus sp. FDAARGOS_333]
MLNGETTLAEHLRAHPDSLDLDPETETVRMELRGSGPKGTSVTAEWSVGHRVVVPCRDV